MEATKTKVEKPVEEATRDYRTTAPLLSLTGEYAGSEHKKVDGRMMFVVKVKVDGRELQKFKTKQARDVGDGFVHYQVPNVDSSWLEVKGVVAAAKPKENSEHVWLANDEFKPWFVTFEFHHDMTRFFGTDAGWFIDSLTDPEMTLKVKFWPFQSRLL